MEKRSRATKPTRNHPFIQRLLADPDLLSRVEQAFTAPCPDVIQGSADAFLALLPALAGQPEERLCCLYMNRRHAVLDLAELSKGNDAHTIVDPRQILRRAVALGASCVIVAHNHPSGDPAPSMADVEVTNRLQAACTTLGVELLDHLVIGAGPSYRSMREDGMISASVPSAPCWTSRR